MARTSNTPLDSPKMSIHISFTSVIPALSHELHFQWQLSRPNISLYLHKCVNMYIHLVILNHLVNQSYLTSMKVK